MDDEHGLIDKIRKALNDDPPTGSTKVSENINDNESDTKPRQASSSND
jgi:hypothetical protein